MRILSRAVYISAWLFTSALCDERVNANSNGNKGLDEILDGLGGGHRGGSGASPSRIEVIHKAPMKEAHEGVVIVTLDEKTRGHRSKTRDEGEKYVTRRPVRHTTAPSPSRQRYTTRKMEEGHVVILPPQHTTTRKMEEGGNVIIIPAPQHTTTRKMEEGGHVIVIPAPQHTMTRKMEEGGHVIVITVPQHTTTRKMEEGGNVIIIPAPQHTTTRKMEEGGNVIVIPVPAPQHTTTRKMEEVIQPPVYQPSKTKESSPTAILVPYPVKEVAPGQTDQPKTTTKMSHETTLLSKAPPAASENVGSIQPTAIAPILLPTTVQGGMTLGTGIIQNGECVCACDCPVDSFPGIQQAIPAAPIVVNGTTLQTVILPPTSSVALPSTLLVDTSAPPNAVLPTDVVESSSSAAITSDPTLTATDGSTPTPVLSDTTSTSDPSTSSSTIPIIAPPQSVIVESPSSTAPATSLDTTTPEEPVTSDVLPTPVLDLAAPDLTSINIATFSLASSLILGPLGDS